jgi:hypothetical protein
MGKDFIPGPNVAFPQRGRARQLADKNLNLFRVEFVKGESMSSFV